MKFIDLFAGIGGFRYGLEKVRNKDNRRSTNKGQHGKGFSESRGTISNTNGRGESKQKDEHTSGNKENMDRFECVWSNEWDRYAAQIYKKHYGKINTKDIRTVKASKIPDHDLLCAGFPCQSFSIAGKRKGFEDTRGTLFFDIARILSEKRPKHLLLENVKGLLSHDQGKTFQTIIGVLSNLGYRIEWQVLNSKHFGVPQNRERVFIIGHLRGECRGQVFPIGETSKANSKMEVRHETRKQVSPTIRSPKGGHHIPTIRVVLIPYRKEKRQHGRRFKEPGEPSFTLTGQDIHGISDGMKIRRLTPTECARLQGFPDDWCADLSDTQAYKCYGNAVTTNVVKAIGGKLYECK